jgi:hypothetical protein
MGIRGRGYAHFIRQINLNKQQQAPNGPLSMENFICEWLVLSAKGKQ